MKMSPLRRSAALAFGVALTLGLAACGDKEGSASSSEVKAGEAVPPPDGQTWSDIVAATPAGGYMMGNPDAAIRIVEYASFTCPHCADFAKASDEERDGMVDTGKMSFELRPYVRDPIDMTTALLAGCGGAEPYFPLAHQLFANQATMFETAQAAGEAAYAAAVEKPVSERFVALAQIMGLMDFVKQRGIPEDKARQCLADEKQIEALAKQVQEANEKYDITGTPTLLMNGSVLENVLTWDVLKARLKEAGV